MFFLFCLRNSSYKKVWCGPITGWWRNVLEIDQSSSERAPRSFLSGRRLFLDSSPQSGITYRTILPLSLFRNYQKLVCYFYFPPLTGPKMIKGDTKINHPKNFKVHGTILQFRNRFTDTELHFCYNHAMLMNFQNYIWNYFNTSRPFATFTLSCENLSYQLWSKKWQKGRKYLIPHIFILGMKSCLL